MIKEVIFTNFKCHKNLKVALQDANIIVGPNNAGKSTVIDGLRILSSSLSTLKSRRPTNHSSPSGGMVFGYEIPSSSIPVNLEHIVHNYGDDPARLEFIFWNGRKLVFHISPSTSPVVEIVDPGQIRTVNSFLKEYPLQLLVVPPLGPFEQREAYLQDRTVVDGVGTRLAHRHFRNYWLRQSDEDFAQFKALVEKTWPDIEIQKPEPDGLGRDRRVSMYFQEKRITREIAWSGIGFQVWLQILTNILRVGSDTTVVIDEPDIYLHPDMQKRLLNLIRESFGQFIIATHSPEIINEAQVNEILSVEQGKRHTKRVTDIPGLQAALDAIGSDNNIELTKLSRARRIVFFEGEDRRLLKSFARRFGFDRIVADTDTLFLALGGFSKSHRIEAVSWTFRSILGQKVAIFSLFDRDYRDVADIEAFIDEIKATGATCVVWERKEVENYLLHASAIAKAITKKIRLGDGERAATPSEQDIVAMLKDEAETFRLRVLTQISSFRRTYLREKCHDHRAEATIDQETLAEFERVWGTLEGIVKLCPGKEVFSGLNRRLTEKYRRSVTPAEVIASMSETDLDSEMRDVLTELDSFCKGRPATS